MSNEYTAALNAFNDKIKQRDIFESIEVVDQRECEIVFKDVANDLTRTAMPIAAIKEEIQLTPSSDANGVYDPIGIKNSTLKLVEPKFQKTIQTIEIAEMNAYLKMYEGGSFEEFMRQKAEVAMKAFDKYVANQKKMSFTGVVTQWVREQINNTMVTEDIDYTDIIAPLDKADDSADFDISVSTMTAAKFYNYLEKKRNTKYISSGGTKFTRPSDCDIFFGSNLFQSVINLFTDQKTGNLVMAELRDDGTLFFRGYRLHDLNAPYSAFEKNGSNIWAPASKVAVADNYMQMIDTVNGKFMQRNLLVETTDGGKSNSNFVMGIVPDKYKEKYELFFRAKPLIVFDTTASLSRKIKA